MTKLFAEQPLASPGSVKPGLFYNHLRHSLFHWLSNQISSKHCLSQTVRSRELNFWENDPPTLCVMCHILCVTCHLSHDTIFSIFTKNYNKVDFFSSLKKLDKVVELVGGRSVNNGSYPILFFSPNRPTGPIWSSSRDVHRYVDLSPFHINFFKASHWPSDHMIRYRPLHQNSVSLMRTLKTLQSHDGLLDEYTEEAHNLQFLMVSLMRTLKRSITCNKKFVPDGNQKTVSLMRTHP